MPQDKPILLSVVVPVLNEAGSITPFLARLLPVLDQIEAALHGQACEVVFVDDGSADETLARIEAARQDDPRIGVVVLSRNFGKDVALSAGLKEASGRAVAPMDVDLQDPPELLPRMVEQWLAGHDVVVARRTDRSSDSWLKRTSARLFYRAFNALSDQPITPDAGDFRLLARNVVDVLNGLPERVRFMKGMMNWVGFRTAYVDYARPARLEGRSKWRYWRLWNFALDGLTGATTAPLRLWSYVGGGAAALAFTYAAVLVARTLWFGVDVPGYASLMVVVLFLGGLNLIALGVIGEYLGRTYTEVKGRPLYVVRERRGLGEESSPASEAPAPMRRSA